MSKQEGFKNPLVGIDQTETLSNCEEYLQHMQRTCEDMHFGFQVNLSLVRSAIGHELAQVAEEKPADRLD